MCDFRKGFKLCSCVPEHKVDETKPYWILFRKVPREKDEFGDYIVGECPPNLCFNRDLRELIREKLLLGDCFDQDFNLKQKDKLDIFSGKEVFSYQLRKNGWQICYPDIPEIKYKKPTSRKLSKCTSF